MCLFAAGRLVRENTHKGKTVKDSWVVELLRGGKKTAKETIAIKLETLFLPVLQNNPSDNKLEVI